MLLITVVAAVTLIINQLRLHTENDHLTEQHRQAQFRYDSLLRQQPDFSTGFSDTNGFKQNLINR